MSDDVCSHISPFEQIRHLTETGDEYWTARELMDILGYAKWQRFREAIQRSIIACQKSGQDPADHFTGTGKMVTIGSGAKRQLEDFHLSRYACYLIIQNADPEKDIVALGQTYFAVQTRRQEYTDASRTVENLPENQKRMVLRDELATHNTKLAAAAHGAGVVDIGRLRSFPGSRLPWSVWWSWCQRHPWAQGLKRSQHILDHMGSAELAANLFRATQTEQKLIRDQITGKEDANQTHHAVGRVVRRTIEELGGTMPEDLPTPEESIQQIQCQELDRLKQQPQLPLFPEDTSL